MKKLLFTACAAALITGMVAAQKPSPFTAANEPSERPAEAAAFKWEKTSYDFGKIPQNKPVTVSYSFTNTGNAPLVITNVAVQCGCTGSEYSKDAIAPGKQGFVKLTFNAAAAGVFQKSVTVFANTVPGETSLTFHGEVVTTGIAGK